MSVITDVVVPPNGEGTRATVLRWCKTVGDRVVKDEPLVELETDKVTVEVASPANGTLIEVLKPVSAEVTPDEVLARLSDQGETENVTAAEITEVASADGAAPPPDSHNLRDPQKPLSPSVRRLLQAHSLLASAIEGTGRNGRITAQDVTRHVSDEASPLTSGAAVPPARAGTAAPMQGAPMPGEPTGKTRIPHTAIRKRVAEHMARSFAQAPHVTTLFEVDLTRVLAHRKRTGSEFEARGVRPTITAYFIAACARALSAVPEVNSTFHEDSLELHADANIGIGTALGNHGLIVPVLHRAQDLNLLGIAQRLSDVVARARAGKLAPEEVRGGTFTISNHGVGGSILAAPIIIHQPQVAILGVGKVQRRVCAITVDEVESISIRSMCYLTLSIDHRALDAFQANAFLSHVVATLEGWADEP